MSSGLFSLLRSRGEPPLSVLRQATDRCMSMGYTNQLAINTGNNYVMGEFRGTFMTGCYPVKNPRFVFPNWGVSGGDKSGPNSITIAAAYESGDTVKRIKFNGRNSFAVLPGDNLISDPLKVIIPANTTFYLRVAVEVPNVDGSFYDGAQDIQCVFSNRTIAENQLDATGELTTSAGESSLNYYGYAPLAILAKLPAGAISVGIYGDSIGSGIGDDTTESTNYDLGFIERGLRAASGGAVPNSNYSRSGESLWGFTDGSLRQGTAEYHTHCICQLGTNDLGGSPTLEYMQELYTTAWIALRGTGRKVAQVTLFPRTASNVDMNPYNANYMNGGLRDQLNAWFLTQAGNAVDDVIDASALVENPTDHTKWDLSGTAPTDDGTHLNHVGVIRAMTAVTDWVDPN